MLIKIISVLSLMIILLCICRSLDYLKTLPDNSKGAMVVAWDTLILIITAISLAVKIVQ